MLFTYTFSFPTEILRLYYHTIRLIVYEIKLFIFDGFIFF